MNSSDLHLGVDGGQSSTTAMIGAPDGRFLGLGRGGPCNHVSGPEARNRFIQAIGGAVAAACRSAGLDPETRHFRSACFGFSGGPADKRALIQEMFDIPALEVTHDGMIALSGATAGEPGVIVIAGTGSLSFGRNAMGRTARAGGWGYLFGDEGGAYDIARQALRAALRQAEGWGPRTILHDALLDATGAPDANTLLHRAYTPEIPRQQLATYSRLVDQAALAGDPIAAGILDAAAQHLAAFASAVRAQIFTSGEPALVCPIGGVWSSGWIREKFARIVELTDGNQFSAPRFGPAAGALLEAYRVDGLAPELTGVPVEEKPSEQRA